MSSSASYSVSSSASSSAPSSASSVSHQITNSNIPFDEYSAVSCPLSCRLTHCIQVLGDGSVAPGSKDVGQGRLGRLFKSAAAYLYIANSS